MLVVQVNWIEADGRGTALVHDRTRPYRHNGGESSKLELGLAQFKARCSRAARELDGEAVVMLN